MIPDEWGKDDKLIGCNRVAESDWHYPEAVQEECAMCGELVWAGPPTVEQGHKPGWHIVCINCLETIPGYVFGGRSDRQTPYPWRAN